MSAIALKPVGKIVNEHADFHIVLDKTYIPALEGLADFSHIQVIWWLNGCDNEQSRAKLTEERPYIHGPAVLGTFATRSPERPNPLAISCAQVTYVDMSKGIIGLAYIDAANDSPVLDIKPYVPALDRVESPSVPKWCQHWPNSCETSGDFDWESEFNF